MPQLLGGPSRVLGTLVVGMLQTDVNEGGVDGVNGTRKLKSTLTIMNAAFLGGYHFDVAVGACMTPFSVTVEVRCSAGKGEYRSGEAV